MPLAHGMKELRELLVSIVEGEALTYKEKKPREPEVITNADAKTLRDRGFNTYDLDVLCSCVEERLGFCIPLDEWNLDMTLNGCAWYLFSVVASEKGVPPGKSMQIDELLG